VAAEIEPRITYTGYLRRELPKEPALTRYPKLMKQPFILVTTGGGGDGDDLIDWVISAYESDPALEVPAVFVFGPFINRDRRRAFVERIARHPKLEALPFDTKLERKPAFSALAGSLAAAPRRQPLLQPPRAQD
jgi:predicted glycosyltransferase